MQMDTLEPCGAARCGACSAQYVASMRNLMKKINPRHWAFDTS